MCTQRQVERDFVVAADAPLRIFPRSLVVELLCADGGAGQAWLADKRPYLADMKPVDGRATAYVCENFTCQAPVSSAAALRGLLKTD